MHTAIATMATLASRSAAISGAGAGINRRSLRVRGGGGGGSKGVAPEDPVAGKSNSKAKKGGKGKAKGKDKYDASDRGSKPGKGDKEDEKRRAKLAKLPTMSRLDELADNLFDEIDTNESDTIEPRELLQHLLKIGEMPSRAHTLLLAMDVGGDGCINREEWRKGYAMGIIGPQAGNTVPDAELPPPTASPRLGGAHRKWLHPKELPVMAMAALQRNDEPDENCGLQMMWNYSGTTLRSIMANDLAHYCYSVLTWAQRSPDSFYAVALNPSTTYEMEGQLKFHSGGAHTGWFDWYDEEDTADTCWVATWIMKAQTAGVTRRFKWFLRKTRHEPCVGMWHISSIAPEGKPDEFGEHWHYTAKDRMVELGEIIEDAGTAVGAAAGGLIGGAVLGMGGMLGGIAGKVSESLSEVTGTVTGGLQEITRGGKPAAAAEAEAEAAAAPATAAEAAAPEPEPEPQAVREV